MNHHQRHFRSCRCDRQGFVVRFMNKSAQEICVKKSDSCDQTHCYRILHKRQSACDNQKHPCAVQEVFHTGRPVQLFHHRVGKNPHLEIVEVHNPAQTNEIVEPAHSFGEECSQPEGSKFALALAVIKCILRNDILEIEVW